MPERNVNIADAPAATFRVRYAAVSMTAGLLLLLVFAASAFAAAPFEQTGCFAGKEGTSKQACELITKAERDKRTQEGKEEYPEELQLGGVGGMAVNYTGAGNVPKGTVYAATFDPNNDGVTPRVAMFYPNVDGGLTFEKSWAVSVVGGAAIDTCGPLVGKACKQRPEGTTSPRVDVDLDQGTGNVYFLMPQGTAGQQLVVEFDPKGEVEITRFGDQEAGGVTIEASPSKLHVMPAPGGLAVTSAGRVYVYDAQGANGYYRLAVFEPASVGDFSHYEYKGEVAGGAGEEHSANPQSPVVDAAGNVYVIGEEGEGILEYAPETPGSFPTHSAPICSFTYEVTTKSGKKVPVGGITSLTVNPQTEEVFFFSSKQSPLVHRLTKCENAKFTEIESVAWSPQRYPYLAMAFDPDRVLDVAHLGGVLYAGSPASQEEAEGASLGYVFARLAGAREPSIISQTASTVTSTSARLGASIEPNGHATRYAFQYLTEEEYDARNPDEVQTLDIDAAGGTFGLEFAGDHAGGEVRAALVSGSREAAGLVSAQGIGNTESGSSSVTSVSNSLGTFEVGRAVSGAGIPSGTTIVKAQGTDLTLSQAATATASAVSLESAGTGPLEVGLEVEGSGIPVGTTITKIEGGRATMSAASTVSGPVTIHAGLPFDATAGRVQRALEGIAPIGARNVSVAGGPGDLSGSRPYDVTFTGALRNRDVEELSVDGLRLTGGAGASEATVRQGGGGFIDASEAVGTLEGASSLQAVAATLTNLTPDTPYLYRVVAQSNCDPGEPAQICEAASAVAGLRTYAVAPSLADGRVWELVSPPSKAGGQVLPAEPSIKSCANECKPGRGLEHFPMQSTPDGEGVAFEGTPFEEGGGAASENEYISGRHAQSGWRTQNTSPPTMLGPANQGYKYLSENLEVAVIKQNNLALASTAPAGYANLYVQHTADPVVLRPIVTTPPPDRLTTGSEQFEVSFAGAAASGNRIFFLANDRLTGATAVAPEAVDGGATKFNLYEWHEGDVALVNVSPDNATTEPGVAISPPSSGAVSTDGSHVFFENPAGRVFVRIDGRETRRVEDPGHFRVASAEGNEVLLSDGCLYSIERESCTDLTGGKGGFSGVAGQSADLSHIYFVDSEVLTGEEESSQGAVAAEGAANLYAWNEKSGARFVARLLDSDNAGVNGGGSVADWVSPPAKRTAEASADGRYFAFLSTAALTSYDNSGACQQGCPEAYVFDSVTGRLACASCDPAGSRPVGWSVLRRIQHGEMLPQPRYLTDAGRLFFDSQDTLSQFDTNGRGEDVYRWVPFGADGCARDEGCVGLLSGGREGSDSNLIAIDESGRNVFFTTRQQLLAADTDGLVDLYDAREGGGFPFESELSGSPECQGDSCQAPPPPPTGIPPASVTLPAPGNYVPPKKCAKGKVRKSGKCVKKKSKHKKKESKHSRVHAGDEGGKRANTNRRAGR